VFDSNVPSDRVFAEWWVNSPYVRSALAGEARELKDKSQSVSIPDNIEAVRSQSLAEHQRWRIQVREEFQARLSLGLIARGFEREGGMGRYLFGADEPQFQHQN
jgi:predicted GNAT superfamily acetyltransferase